MNRVETSNKPKTKREERTYSKYKRFGCQEMKLKKKMDFGCFSSQIKSYRKSKPKDCRVGEYTRSVLPKAKPK